MYLLVNSSTPFRLCNIFAFFYFLDEVLYSVVDRKKIYAWCRIHYSDCLTPPNHLTRIPKQFERTFAASLLACLRASGSEPDAATWKLALVVCVLRIVLGVIDSSAVSMASLASPWQQRQIDGRDQTCITVAVNLGNSQQSRWKGEDGRWRPSLSVHSLVEQQRWAMEITLDGFSSGGATKNLQLGRPLIRKRTKRLMDQITPNLHDRSHKLWTKCCNHRKNWISHTRGYLKFEEYMNL